MNETEQKLISLGMTQEQVTQTIKDVESVISKKILVFYLTKLNPDDRAKMESMANEEIPKYFSDNKFKLPELTKEKIEEIAVKTWEDYFANVNK